MSESWPRATPQSFADPLKVARFIRKKKGIVLFIFYSFFSGKIYGEESQGFIYSSFEKEEDKKKKKRRRKGEGGGKE